MQVNYEKWSLRKRYFWLRIWEDYEIGYLDRELLPLLVLLNRDRDIYTTSSCSGRIVVVDGIVPWVREEASVVFKSHIPVTTADLDFVFRETPHKSYWLVVTGPIIHFSTTNLRKALKSLKKARTAGFKHSGVMHVSSTRGVFIELVTGIYMTQLLRIQGNILVSPSDIKKVISIFNKALIEGKWRLQRLYEVFQEYLPETPDPIVETELNSREIRLVRLTPIDIFYEICGSTCETM